VQACPLGEENKRLKCCNVECSLWVSGLEAEVLVGLFGFLFVGWFGCSCVMQACPLVRGKERLTCCSFKCSLWVSNLRGQVLVGLFGFLFVS
jgi:hypothetical protein